MPKRKDHDEAETQPPQGAALPASVVAETEDDKQPSRKLVNGKDNIDWVRWFFRKNAQLAADVATNKADMPKGYNFGQVQVLLESLCKINNWDPKHLQDTRSEAQITEESVEKIMNSPEDLFDEVDRIAALMNEEQDNADRFCGELLGAGGLSRSPIVKKKWLDRIALIQRIRDRARNPFPKGCFLQSHLEIAHPLRYMIFVSRPGGSNNKVYLIGPHHAKMALTLYCLDKGKLFQNQKWLKYEATGALMVCPPGHGKTTILISYAALCLSKNPRLRIILLHAQADQAEKNLAFLCTFFDPKETAGRRNLSLFPGNRIIQQNANTMRLYVKDKQRQATCVACGVNAKENGSDADILLGDDICDQQIAEQETERARVFDRLNGTWRRRLRDGKTREILATTLWHHDDPHCRMIRLGREGKIKYLFCIQECGGPDQNFRALWSEAYPSSKLRAIYAEMRNPRLYAAAYQSNPMPEEQRPIRRLAYYDPTTDQHKQFVESAIKYSSLDPSATANEKSDHASFVYAGLGDVQSFSGNMHSFERRLRVLDAERIKAKQTDAVAAVCSYAQFHSTHYVLFEAVAGFAAVGELFEMRGIDPIPMKPHNRSKGLRLKDVAVVLDDSMRDRGLSPAVVEFPGKTVDGKVVQDPDSPLAWLEKQVLEFGVSAEDDGVDALTQLCKYLGPELGIGQGIVTRQVQQAAANETRMSRILREYEQDANTKKSAHDEESEWLLHNNRSGQ